MTIFPSIGLPYILSDEFGYWANAEFLSGNKVWAAIMSKIPYYSWGYSIVLYLCITLSAFVNRYMLAIALNLLFIVIGWFCLCRIGKTIVPDYSEIHVNICSTAICLYASNIAYFQTTLVEIFLWFVYILSAYFLLLFIETNKTRYYIAFGICAGYMSCIHMRAIGVTFSAVFTLIICFFCNKRKKVFSILISIFFILMFLILLFEIKDYLMSNSYELIEDASTNDFSGQSNKIKMLISLNGIRYFAKSFIGKITYLVISTAGLFLSTFVLICRKHLHFHKELLDKEIFYIYVFLSTLLTISVSSLAQIQSVITNKRYDAFFYGRYNEFILAPFLLIGFMYLPSYISKFKFFALDLVFFALCLYAGHQMSAIKNGYMYEVNIVGLSGLSYTNEKYIFEGWVYKVALLSFVLFTLYALANSYKKTLVSILAIALIAAMWVYGGKTIVNNQTRYRERYNSYSDMSETIKINNVAVVHYIINDQITEFDLYMPEILQFMCDDTEFSYIEIEKYQTQPNDYVLIRKGRKLEQLFSPQDIIASNGDFDLYLVK